MVFILVAALTSASASAAPLSSHDADIYAGAFQALESKDGPHALSLAADAGDRTLYDVVVGLALQLDTAAADFNTYQQFLTAHSGWPEVEREAIAKSAEAKISGSDDPHALVPFFDAHPPQTGDGFMRYIAALDALHLQQRIPPLIRRQWREVNFGSDEQDIFVSHFSSSLLPGDTLYRLDRLLWDGAYEQAERLYPLLASGWRALAQARIALAKGESKAPALVSRVPANLQSDSGLLYQRVKWHLKKDDEEGAWDLMRSAGNRPSHPELWWDARQRIARGLLDRGQVQAAYNLVIAHGIATKSPQQSEAEFLAGWIALRFLKNPALAQQHFQLLFKTGASPITLARASYWQGRCTEMLGQQAQAVAWYQRASSYGTTYYGQLAATKLYPASNISAAAPLPSADAVVRFEANPLSVIVQQLLQLGQKKMAERFALAYAKNENSEAGLRLMAELADRMQAPDIAVKIAKVAAKKLISLPVEGYPVLEDAAGLPQAPLVHALIRQESQFDAKISSSSNAQGLMQLLPSTARHVMHKHDLNVDDDLFNAHNNIQLGATYIQELLDQFGGSLPLAIAAYNAGPGRVHEWLGRIGDPRAPGFDTVDWVERIPFNETRNYVQRVLEALQIYRAKLSGGTALLGLKQDLGG